MALLLLALGTNYAGAAQVPAPPSDTLAPASGEVPLPPPPPDPPGGPGGPGGPLPADRPGRGPRPPKDVDRAALQAISAFKGTVSRFIINDDFVYDGFALKNGSDSFLVRFAPSIGQSVMKLLRTGSAVTVRGVSRLSATGEQEIEAISLQSNGSELDVQPSAVPPVPATPAFEKGSGKITGFGTDREGRLNTLLLSGRELLRLPPSGLAGISPAPEVGAVVSYSGTVRPAITGEAIQGNRKIIRCQTITINGQQYLVGLR